MDVFNNFTSNPQGDAPSYAVAPLSSCFSQNQLLASGLAGVVLLFWLFLGGGGKEARYPWGLSYIGFSPRWLSGTVWATSSRNVMRAAFRKCKEHGYRIVRNDVNLLMLPPSAVEEVSALPMDLASNLHALEYDLATHFTGLGYLRDAHLHARFVHRKITPFLPRLAVGIQDEVGRAIDHFFDAPVTEWKEISPYPILTHISSRVSARIMLGKDYTDNAEWQSAARNFTENFMGSVMIMRFCPVWLQRILKWSLPYCWNTAKYVRQMDKLLTPEFAKLLAESKKPDWKPSDEEERWGMEWLTKLATDEERNTETMVAAQILLILASIPTTVFSEINALFDLISHPELIDEVREEIEGVAQEGWTVNSYSKLNKLDSILRESQRLAPPTMIGLRRIMNRDHTLSSGILLPKGSYICVPTYTIQNEATENPMEYDGLRSYRKRVRENGEMDSRHQFTTTETTVLGFGHSRTACPGRYLASVALKIILAKLLMEFDLKFPNGQTTRPPNGVAHEFLVAPRDAKIMIKRREGVVAPF